MFLMFVLVQSLRVLCDVWLSIFVDASTVPGYSSWFGSATGIGTANLVKKKKK
jgi:hypothetical protein